MMPNRTIRILSAALLLAALGMTLTACERYGEILKDEGTDLSDEFDRRIVNASAITCPDFVKKRHEELNKKPLRCGIDDLTDFLARVHRETGDIEPYLIARGAQCQEIEGIIHCVVVRRLTTLTHSGDRSRGTKHRTIYTFETSFVKGHPPSDVKINLRISSEIR